MLQSVVTNTSIQKKDLNDLCRNNIIAPVYHEYYENLVASNDNAMIITRDNDEN